MTANGPYEPGPPSGSRRAGARPSAPPLEHRLQPEDDQVDGVTPPAVGVAEPNVSHVPGALHDVRELVPGQAQLDELDPPAEQLELLGAEPLWDGGVVLAEEQEVTGE